MKKITRANIIGELVDKFALQEHEREDFVFGEFVVPTYDIGSHVKRWETVEDRRQITANGAVSFLPLPTNTRWRIRRLDVLHEAGANFDIDQIYFYGSATKHQYIFYDTTSPIVSGTVKTFALPQDVPMLDGELIRIYINASNFVAGGYVSLHVLREVEVLR